MTTRSRRPAGRGNSGKGHGQERIEPYFGKPKRKRSRKGRGRKDEHAHPLLGALVRGFIFVCLFGLLLFGLTAIYLTAKLPDPVLLTMENRPPNVTVLAADGTVLAERGYGRGQVVLKDLPPYLPEAVIATEDRRFYHHFGVDPVGLVRAAITDLMAGHVVEGGSTITQQLAKNLFLKPDRTMTRKFKEVIYALWLEKRFTKDQILQLYLNRVYFGGGAYGVEAAAHRYFGKSAHDLTLPEAAMLAGLLKAPSTYSPNHSVKLATERLHEVLQNMVEAGYITEAQAKKAEAEPLGLRAQGEQSGYPYVVDWVADRLPDLIGEKHGDLVINTTIDPKIQKVAQVSLRRHLLEEGKAKHATEGAIVVMGPMGAVKAVVGGRSYRSSPYNRAIKAMRQPGSAFKPFVYLTAMEAGYTPDSIAYDSPVTIKGWTPKNYEKRYRGKVTLRKALAESINSVAVKLVAKVGISHVIDNAHRLGIDSTLRHDPSIALGTSEVTPLELTTAYAPFANGGFRAQMHVITRIRNADGRVLYQWHQLRPVRVIAPVYLGEMNDMMNETLVAGTGRRAGIPSHVAGGKTGTTQGSRDAWFVGYTAQYVAGVWIGNDNDSPMKHVTGGTIPAEIWHDVMLAAHRGKTPYALPGTTTPGLPEVTSGIPMQQDNAEESGLLGRMISLFTGHSG
jgi:penicillin-binding protein 1A